MMFLMPIPGRDLFVMLEEKDLDEMRRGRTKVVFKEMLGGRVFDQVITSLHKDKAEIEKVLKNNGYSLRWAKDGVLEGTKTEEPVCPQCKATVSFTYEDRCTLCWANRAKELETRIEQFKSR